MALARHVDSGGTLAEQSGISLVIIMIIIIIIITIIIIIMITVLT
jgi:hypothetical protein